MSPKAKPIPQSKAKARRTQKAPRNKKSPAKEYKRPSPGDRRTHRKRVVLSNDNAFEVDGLQDLKAELLQDPGNVRGKVFGLSGETVDSLRAVDAFKPRQGWYHFRRPATLMTDKAMELAKLLEEAESTKTITRVITGDRLVGKSTLLLQGMAMAFMKGWIVINIPDAMDLVIGHTAYKPVEGSSPRQYWQPQYTADLLEQVVKANGHILSKIPLDEATHNLVPRGAENTLKDLITLGPKGENVSWQAFQALWTELMKPGRPPVLLALDGLAHIMKETAYFAPDMKKIHAHDLTLVHHFLSYLSGEKLLANGGLVLAATSGSNQPSSPALDYAIESAEKRAAGVPKDEIPEQNPYKAVDVRAMQILKGIEAIKMEPLNKLDARSIMEYYAASGMLRGVVNDQMVNEKWTISGGGNIGELERGTVRYRI